MNNTQNEIKQNIQGINSDRKEIRTQINERKKINKFGTKGRNNHPTGTE